MNTFSTVFFLTALAADQQAEGTAPDDGGALASAPSSWEWAQPATLACPLGRVPLLDCGACEALTEASLPFGGYPFFDTDGSEDWRTQRPAGCFFHNANDERWRGMYCNNKFLPGAETDDELYGDDTRVCVPAPEASRSDPWADWTQNTLLLSDETSTARLPVERIPLVIGSIKKLWDRIFKSHCDRNPGAVDCQAAEQWIVWFANGQDGTEPVRPDQLPQMAKEWFDWLGAGAQGDEPEFWNLPGNEEAKAWIEQQRIHQLSTVHNMQMSEEWFDWLAAGAQGDGPEISFTGVPEDQQNKWVAEARAKAWFDWVAAGGQNSGLPEPLKPFRRFEANEGRLAERLFRGESLASH